jgi:hypothetical protein
VNYLLTTYNGQPGLALLNTRQFNPGDKPRGRKKGKNAHSKKLTDNENKTRLLLVAAITAKGQDAISLTDLHKKGKLKVVNRELSIDKSKGSVKLNEGDREGLVWLDGMKFSTGILEIDLRGRDVVQRSFIGLAFNGANDSTYESIYFRPFNFRATDPVRKIHAVQYISQPEFTWRKLREERNGVFEKEIVDAPEATAWFHARIEVSPTEVVVFVNGNTTPSLKVERLAKHQGDKLGLWVGAGSDGEFADLKVKKVK